MAVLKCKMCGGDLLPYDGSGIFTCTCCGTLQTAPEGGDERKLDMFNRANKLRLDCEFDKAESLYEKIVTEFPKDAEGYWGLCLSKYGVEYVNDPRTGKKVPTCHRASYEAITADPDFAAALEHADTQAKQIYCRQAMEIDALQRRIMDIVRNEKPFDVFLCYKETDDAGRRTPDSVIANDIYYQLTNEGFKVFYAPITLENKLGQEFEPCIFAALHSAKVMLVIGTAPEYFNAVWVRNEWSRFLKLMKTDRTKILIPCFKNMDAYHLPADFSHLQAQDMNKIGFMNDVTRGIKKVLQKDAPKEPSTESRKTENSGAGANVVNLLRRVRLLLETGDWKSADEYCGRVLGLDPENAEAYLGKLMAQLGVRNRNALKDQPFPFDKNPNYKKAIFFGDDNLERELTDAIDCINMRNANAQKEWTYQQGIALFRNAKSEMDFDAAANLFQSITGYKDAERMVVCCRESRMEWTYQRAMHNAKQSTVFSQNEAIRLWNMILGYRDSNRQLALAEEKLRQIKEKNIRDVENLKRKTKILVTVIASVIGVVVLTFVFLILNKTVFIPNRNYKNALALKDAGKYEEAVAAFESVEGYKDSAEQIMETRYLYACSLRDAEKYHEAISAFEAVAGYKDSAEQITEMRYLYACSLRDAAKYNEAISVFEAVDGYKDSAEQITEMRYLYACSLRDATRYNEAISVFKTVEGYKDSARQIVSIETKAINNASVGDYITFGYYEQENSIPNGKEAIEWLILEKNGGKALLISRFALDRQLYNSSFTVITWENCTLRKWLNDVFINTAFSSEEQEIIISTDITADVNPLYNTDPGSDTTDQIFLLSITEAIKYFDSDTERIVGVTDYVKSQGANTSNTYSADSKSACWWWLRSPGSSSGNAAHVNYNGGIDYFGLPVDSATNAVRPALWVDLSK